ncbi:hypothetical protein BC962_0238 [Gillisia mitskevichiae]|uniref:Uncharacterized protein n=1 Tax=Gillisia mitskevichiae TaxID=270921 RepID=A0A495PYB3_9FLAO|nr:hypothetical protein [Gillisia mitskevichiae]RKS55279.1 hypothetical protein BC962_0238 [Gillisia mitskevichiae]
MLSKGLKDEENQKINELVGRLIELEFVPEFYESEQRSKVNGLLFDQLGFNISDLETWSSEELLLKLKQLNFDFSNLEEFGDFLLKIIPFEDEQHESHLAKATIAVYEAAQIESKTFSFSLIQKLNQAKALV